MSANTNTISRFRSWFTRRYLDLAHEFVGQELYTAYGVEEIVYWFSSESMFAGKATFLNAILLNDRHLSDLPGFVTDYVFLHEVGHTRVRFPLRVIFYLLSLIFAPLAVSSVGTTPILLLTAILNASSLIGAAIAVGGSILVLAVGVLPLVLLVRLDETQADLFALSRIGEEKFLSVKREISKNRKRSLMARAWKLVFYPSPGFIIWVSKKLA